MVKAKVEFAYVGPEEFRGTTLLTEILTRENTEPSFWALLERKWKESLAQLKGWGRSREG